MITGDSQTQASLKMTRCIECGRKTPQGASCKACGYAEPYQLASVQAVASAPSTLPSIVPTIASEGRLAESSISVFSTPLVKSQSTPAPPHHSPEVKGRVIILRPISHEPMDFDPWRWVAIPTWGLLLLFTPVVASLITWQHAGFFRAAVVLIVLVVILRFIFSHQLLYTWHFTAALNGHRIVEPMPVQMARVRTAGDQEIQLRLKGQIEGGALIEGDRIHAIGDWKSGVFRASRIHCERTGAEIIPKQPNAFVLAVTGVCILSLVTLWLFLAGVPWMKHEITSSQDALIKQQNLYQAHP